MSDIAGHCTKLNKTKTNQKRVWEKCVYRILCCVGQTIDWLRFVTMVFSEVGIDIADAEEVIVLYPDYVYELGRLLQKTSPRFEV